MVSSKSSQVVKVILDKDFLLCLNDEFAQVSRNINKFIEKLHEIVKKSKTISNENASISEELSHVPHQKSYVMSIQSLKSLRVPKKKVLH